MERADEPLAEAEVGDSAPFDANVQGESGAGGPDATVDAGALAPDDAMGDVVASDAGADGATSDAADTGNLALGLVALYSFDETGGTTAADRSGNGHPATMNGATFAPGLRGNAATMNGAGRYVSLPSGIVGGFTSCSVSAWVNFMTATRWTRIFDFGTGTTDYMFLTNELFAITVGGQFGEQRTSIGPLASGVWQHVVLTLTTRSCLLYVNGAQVAMNSAVTLTPASLGTTTQNWLGRSQHSSDPYFNGQIDEFRIYRRVLTAAEVQQLFQLQR